jgi:hypothetical protein
VSNIKWVHFCGPPWMYIPGYTLYLYNVSSNLFQVMFVVRFSRRLQKSKMTMLRFQCCICQCYLFISVSSRKLEDVTRQGGACTTTARNSSVADMVWHDRSCVSFATIGISRRSKRPAKGSRVAGVQHIELLCRDGTCSRDGRKSRSQSTWIYILVTTSERLIPFFTEVWVPQAILLIMATPSCVY